MPELACFSQIHYSGNLEFRNTLEYRAERLENYNTLCQRICERKRKVIERAELTRKGVPSMVVVDPPFTSEGAFTRGICVAPGNLRNGVPFMSVVMPNANHQHLSQIKNC